MKISQREARQLKRRVNELETELNRQRHNWTEEWPGGVRIDTVDVNESEYHIADTARNLGHAVVVIPRLLGSQWQFKVYALPLPRNP